MDWSFASPGPVSADIELASGSIEIQSLPEGNGEITVRFDAGDSARGEKLIAAAEVRLDGHNLRVHLPNKPMRSAAIACTIALATGSSLRVKSASADVRSTVCLDTFAASTASGDVELGEVRGDAELKAASGSLRAERIGGCLKVKAASSDVTVHAVGGDVAISLASGDVTVDDLGSSANIHTASGDTHLGLVHKGRVAVASASGDVSVGIPRGVRAHLDLSSTSGKVYCDLPVGSEEQLGAALDIKCTTVSGDLRVHSQADS